MINNSLRSNADSCSDHVSRAVRLLPSTAEHGPGSATEQLMGAVQENDAARIRQLFDDYGVDHLVQQLRNSACRPLDIAASYHYYDAIDVLVELLPFDMLETPDEDGRPPLMLAAKNGHGDIVERLLRGRSSANAPNNASVNASVNTQIVPAARTALPSLADMLWGVLGYAADVRAPVKVNPPIAIDTQDKSGYTALMHATVPGFDDVVEILLRRGANPNIANHHGECPLVVAVKGEDFRIFQLLCKHGADLNAMDVGRCSILMTVADEASRVGDVAMLNYLLDQDVNTEHRDESGRTVLLRTAMTDSSTVMKCLLDSGKVDIHARDRDGATAVALAVKHDRMSMLKSLLQRNGIDVDAVDSRGMTPFLLAVETDNVPAARELLQAGANVNFKNTKTGATADTLTRLRNNSEMQALVEEHRYKTSTAYAEDLAFISSIMDAS